MGVFCMVSIGGFCAASPQPPTYPPLGPGGELQRTEVPRGREPVLLVAWVAGLEMSEGLVNGRQWSPMQVAVKTERGNCFLMAWSLDPTVSSLAHADEELWP